MHIIREVFVLVIYLFLTFTAIKNINVSEKQTKMRILAQLNTYANVQMKTLHLEQKKYLTLNKKYTQKSKIKQNITLNNIGVFSMSLLRLKRWQIKCTINVLFGGLGHYGCYCGKGSLTKSGDPADFIDSVCKIHDECYINCNQIKNCTLKRGATYQWTGLQREVKICHFTLFLNN